jgi:hypothetical protein
MATDATGLFEEERDAGGDLVLSEQGPALLEAVDTRLDNRMRQLSEAVDRYFADEVVPFFEEKVENSVDEIRKLMLLAVSELGAPEATTAFIKKVRHSPVRARRPRQRASGRKARPVIPDRTCCP